MLELTSKSTPNLSEREHNYLVNTANMPTRSRGHKGANVIKFSVTEARTRTNRVKRTDVINGLKSSRGRLLYVTSSLTLSLLVLLGDHLMLTSFVSCTDYHLRNSYHHANDLLRLSRNGAIVNGAGGKHNAATSTNNNNNNISPSSRMSIQPNTVIAGLRTMQSSQLTNSRDNGRHISNLSNNNNNNNHHHHHQQRANHHHRHHHEPRHFVVAADRRASGGVGAPVASSKHSQQQQPPKDGKPDDHSPPKTDQNQGKLLICYYTTRQTAPYWPSGAREFIIPADKILQQVNTDQTNNNNNNNKAHGHLAPETSRSTMDEVSSSFQQQQSVFAPIIHYEPFAVPARAQQHHYNNNNHLHHNQHVELEFSSASPASSIKNQQQQLFIRAQNHVGGPLKLQQAGSSLPKSTQEHQEQSNQMSSLLATGGATSGQQPLMVIPQSGLTMALTTPEALFSGRLVSPAPTTTTKSASNINNNSSRNDDKRTPVGHNNGLDSPIGGFILNNFDGSMMKMSAPELVPAVPMSLVANGDINGKNPNYNPMLIVNNNDDDNSNKNNGARQTNQLEQLDNKANDVASKNNYNNNNGHRQQGGPLSAAAVAFSPPANRVFIVGGSQMNNGPPTNNGIGGELIDTRSQLFSPSSQQPTVTSTTKAFNQMPAAHLTNSYKRQDSIGQYINQPQQQQQHRGKSLQVAESELSLVYPTTATITSGSVSPPVQLPAASSLVPAVQQQQQHQQPPVAYTYRNSQQQLSQTTLSSPSSLSSASLDLPPTGPSNQQAQPSGGNFPATISQKIATTPSLASGSPVGGTFEQTASSNQVKFPKSISPNTLTEQDGLIIANGNGPTTTTTKVLVASTPVVASSPPPTAVPSLASSLAATQATAGPGSSTSNIIQPQHHHHHHLLSTNTSSANGPSLSSVLVSSPLSTMFDVFGAASQYLMRFKPSSLISPSSFHAFNSIANDHHHHQQQQLDQHHHHHLHHLLKSNNNTSTSSSSSSSNGNSPSSLLAAITPSSAASLISLPFSSSLFSSGHKQIPIASSNDRSSSNSGGGFLSRLKLQSNQQREDICGRTIQTPERRIIGGEGARYGEFPYQVHIKIAKHQCGGALVDRQSIVTAAHCVYHFITRAPVSKLQIVIGAYDIEDEQYQELPPQYFKVNKVKLHPNFRFSASHPDRYDIAILKLDKPVKYTDNVLPVCLPNKDLKFENTVGTVTGFGKTDPSLSNRYGTRLLQKVDVPIIENNECERWHRTRGIDLKIFPEMMCAGYEDGLKDACVGDSGGPLVVKTSTGPNGSFRWTLAGITSAGFGCAQSRQPGIYHRVSHTVDWILENLD